MVEIHSKPHAVMVPLPLQGHVIPFTNLAIKLASNGFTITFVNTKCIHHQLLKSQPSNNSGDQDDIFSKVRESGLDIRYTTVSDGLPLAFNRFQNLDQCHECSLYVFPAHVDELVGDLVQSDPSITCLIADTYHCWPATIANKAHVRSLDSHDYARVCRWCSLEATLWFSFYLILVGGIFLSVWAPSLSNFWFVDL